jgi:hypothetical protein
MSDPNQTEPFFLIVADHDRPWEAAALVVALPSGPHCARPHRFASTFA